MTALALLESSPVALVALFAVLGLVCGSFLNVVIHRLPRMMETRWRAECAELTQQEPAQPERYNLFVPRSCCPKCGHRIRAIENIPVLANIEEWFTPKSLQTEILKEGTR